MRKTMKMSTGLTALAALIILTLPAMCAQSAGVADKISPEVQVALDALQPGDMLTVIAHMNQRADLFSVLGGTKQERLQRVINALQATAAASQASIIAYLQRRSAEGSVSQFTSFWVLDGLSVTATKEVIQELAG
jgi:hypothetical protein